MTHTARNRWVALGALLVAGGALAWISFGNIGQNLVYYWKPSEMLSKGKLAYGPTIRLGGIVQKGSLHWDAAHTKLTFRVADSKKPDATSVEVISNETPPQMFREGIGTVVEGTYGPSGVFTSSRLMVKHSNVYKPPKPGDGDSWKKSLILSDSSARAQ